MRLIKTALALPISLIVFSLLGGCNGASDDSGGEENTGEYALSLSYKTVVDGKCTEATSDVSFPSNASICAVAKLTQGGSASSGALVSFNSSLGTITPSTKLTNSSGLAEVILSPELDTQGAGTVTAQFDTKADENNILLVERNYEFVDNGGTPTDQVPKVSASIQLGTNYVTQFKVDEAVQLQAQFLDSTSVGIENQLVTFTAGNVTLSPNTALTNEQGIAQVIYTPVVGDLGAANLNVSITYKGQTYQSNSLYEVLSADAVGGNGVFKLGHFDSAEQFVENELTTTLTPNADGKYVISAGGSIGVTATLVNQADDGTITRVQTPSSISFSSDCVSSNNASLDTPVTSLSGNASSTFQDISCSGNSQRDDQIIATTQVGNQTLTANLNFSLERQTLASLSFESAEPKVIRIKGSGGTGSTESSLIIFKVTGSNGQPSAQQEVLFSLDSTVGGLSFSNGDITANSNTNSEGLASVRVQSGTVPTPVRILASATDSQTNETITTQSEQLTINTGLPQQLGFSLSSSIANPEADQFDGEKATITIYASDSFSNPAPDDTTINFTAEGGQIVPSCLTVNGSCSVEWTSTNPRVTDHRITILAYALGHETFFDTNGNNVFDDPDVSLDPNDNPIVNQACLNNSGEEILCSGNGMDIETYLSSGFSDLGDAFRDDDESFFYTPGEKFFNTKQIEKYQDPNNKFNGPQCQSTLVGCEPNTYIRKALVMTMSGSSADFTIWQGNDLIRDDSGFETTPIMPLTALVAGETSRFTVQFYDDAYQMMPANTQVAVTASAGELIFEPFGVANTTNRGGTRTSFIITNDSDPSTAGQPARTSAVSIELTTPNNFKSAVGLTISLSGT